MLKVIMFEDVEDEMTTGTYLLRVWLTRFEPAAANELQEVLGSIHEEVGSEELAQTLALVAKGERTIVYRTNSRTDAEVVAGILAHAGGQVEVEG